MKPMKTIWLRMRRRAFELRGNNSGVAAVEFAMIIPLMAMMLVGTSEFAAGVAVDRKVTLMARTLSDLTSQNTSVTDTQLTNSTARRRIRSQIFFIGFIALGPSKVRSGMRRSPSAAACCRRYSRD